MPEIDSSLQKHSELRDKITMQQQKIFSTGTDVSLLGRGLSPGGVDASPKTPFDYKDWNKPLFR